MNDAASQAKAVPKITKSLEEYAIENAHLKQLVDTLAMRVSNMEQVSLVWKLGTVF